MLTRLVPWVIGAVVWTGTALTTASEEETVCFTQDDKLICTVITESESKADTETGTQPGGGSSAEANPNCVEYKPYSVSLPPLPAGHAAWGGHDPSEGSIIMVYSGCSGNRIGVPTFAANGTAPAAPPDPAVVAQSAIDSLRLQVPVPVMHFGPDPDRMAVNFPVWLWVDQPPVLSETASVTGVSVTATAELRSVSWQMGEPVDPAYPKDLVAPVVCTGAGAAPSAGGVLGEAPCGYTYQWRSLKERTNGAGRWQVTAIATWDVSWTSNVAGATGTDVLVSDPSRTTVDVGEYGTEIAYGG